MSIESVMPSNHLILCHPILLLPSIFPSIKVFSNELARHIRLPKYSKLCWSVSFIPRLTVKGKNIVTYSHLLPPEFLYTQWSVPQETLFLRKYTKLISVLLQQQPLFLKDTRFLSATYYSRPSCFQASPDPSVFLDFYFFSLIQIKQNSSSINSKTPLAKNYFCRALSLVQLFSHVWFFATPWTAAHQASLSITNSRSLVKLMSIELVIPSNHLILCCPLLLLPLIFPSIRVFSNESFLHITWPKY